MVRIELWYIGSGNWIDLVLNLIRFVLTHLADMIKGQPFKIGLWFLKYLSIWAGWISPKIGQPFRYWDFEPRMRNHIHQPNWVRIKLDHPIVSLFSINQSYYPDRSQPEISCFWPTLGILLKLIDILGNKNCPPKSDQIIQHAPAPPVHDPTGISIYINICSSG